MLIVCQFVSCKAENWVNRLLYLVCWKWLMTDRVTWWHEASQTLWYISILNNHIPLWQLQPAARGNEQKRPLPAGCSVGGKVAGLGPGRDKMGKRSQWTVMCVALGFFSSCLILGQCKNISWFILNLWMGISLTMSPCAVGGMLSVTSEYQDRAIARMLNISIEELRTSS